MAKTLTLLSLYLFANLVLILNNVLVNSDGLTIRLIHPDSPESPYFQSKITQEERIKRLVSQSNMRANYLAKTLSSLVLRTHVDVQLYHYVVKIGIGTFKSKPPYKEYHLHMDTGSSITWLQCEGCTKCFKQTPKPFPNKNSLSFRPLQSGNKPLVYEGEYANGDTTRGIMAHETFHLRSSTGAMTKIENIQFGCGLQNEMRNWDHKSNMIAGIMGLGWGDYSFLNQISRESKDKFSYCLPLLVSGKTSTKTYLRFGDDIKQPRNPKRTSLFRLNNSNLYHVELLGISLDKTRLRIDPRVFALRDGNNLGGCTIDSGAAFSRLAGPAFNMMMLEMQKYFSGFKNLKKINGKLGLDLCYERSKPEGYINLPEVTFHLRGSDFVMKASAVFEVVGRRGFPFSSREYFCLAMLRGSTGSIIGSHQQTNQRIIYDTMSKVLVFDQEDCSKNS